ncbi:hypothetical protein ABZU69_34670, partial [Micromonospora sp. NPDC005206]
STQPSMIDGGCPRSHTAPSHSSAKVNNPGWSTRRSIPGVADRFTQLTGELSFDVGAGEWADNLEDIEAGTYVELLVPLADGADYADAVELLRDARGLLREGNLPSAIGQARKALEQVRESYGTQKVFADAVKKTPRQRTLAER